MCGISGIVTKHRDLVAAVELMNSFQDRRGPDDSGLYTHKNIGIGMTRLEIQDTAGGKQPMKIGSKALVFNGEIFNGHELRKSELSSQVFTSSHSDTEVLLRLLMEEGEAGILKLNGMFAFAMYDEISSCLLVARDRFGIKPLYYYFDGKEFIFASSIAAIKAVLEEMPDIDQLALSHYLTLGYIPSPQTIFKGIYKLEQGCYITVDTNSLSVVKHKWWHPSIEPVEFSIEKVENLLKEAVDRWTISDVPYCYTLSGGLDSSTLLSFDSSNYKTAFTLGFPPEFINWDETRKASEYSRVLDCEHRIVQFTFSEDLLDRMLLAYEQPCSDNFLSFTLFEKISENYRVAINGTGGDELFGIYALHLMFNQRSIDRDGFYADYFQKIYVKNSRLIQFLAEKNPNFICIDHSLEYMWRVFEQHYRKTKDLASSLSFFLLETQLSDDFLDYTDKFSMYHSVECRTPFLDNQLVNYICSLPSELRFGAKGGKPLLEKISTSRTRLGIQKKMGLNPPISAYLRMLGLSHVRNRILTLDILFDTKKIDSFLENFFQGDNDSLLTIWRLYVLSVWLKNNFLH